MTWSWRLQVTYNTLLEAHAKLGQWERAVAALDAVIDKVGGGRLHRRAVAVAGVLTAPGCCGRA